jgi:FtsP/CotA-like multicopper oxidase with cupredoxin domain
MKKERVLIPTFLLVFITFGVLPAWAHVSFQCPCYDDAGNPVAGTVNGAVTPINGILTGNIECTLPADPPLFPDPREIACKHITAGDGFAQMADRTGAQPSEIFIFGFHDVTYLYPPNGVHATVDDANAAVQGDGLIAAETSAPTINVSETQEFYLTLSTVPMPIRPDLFDPHTVHFHGFPNAATVFDGEPMVSIAINQGASLTYYYNLAGRAGTYLYHCHVEATEHMQMGMLGNLWVRPAQDGTTVGGFNKFVHNDGNGTTGYDVFFPISVISFDPRFHAANQDIQPLPFADMLDTYPLFNGRGYPDTINPNNLPVPQQKVDERAVRGFPNTPLNTHSSQKLPSLINATAGQRILIRLSSVATVDLYTISAGGLPMQIVAKDASIFRGRGLPAGLSLYQTVNSVNIAGGESYDILIDTTGVTPGTYFLYSTNLNELTNELQDFGGMMTEIRIQ